MYRDPREPQPLYRAESFTEAMAVREYISEHNLNMTRWKICGTALVNGEVVLLERPVEPETYYSVQYRGAGHYFRSYDGMMCYVLGRWGLHEEDCSPVCNDDGILWE